MELQPDRTWTLLKSILESKLPASQAWANFISQHGNWYPQPWWQELKRLDMAATMEQFAQWIRELLEEEPLPEDVLSCWIGIVKFMDEENQEIPTIYLVGAPTYDKDDIDWACDPSYLPENRYAQPELLNQIDQIAKSDPSAYEFLDWILPLACCAFIFDEMFRTKIPKELLLKHRPKIHVAIGHDSGDYVEITPVDEVREIL